MKKILVLLSLAIALTASLRAENRVLTIKVDGGIGPAVAEYMKSGIEYAEENAYEAAIILLDTPGGLLEATRDIVKTIFASSVPVIVYVSPSGSRAGSAGVFITLSANIAAMAPGTNIGAAHPVGIGGGMDTSGVMNDKVENDAAAFVRSIAQKRNRNEDWAEKTVRQSIAQSENEAYENGAIDIIASTLDSLLKAADGMKVETKSGEVVLKTADAEVKEFDKDWRITILELISDPNIAYIFMLIGIYGIFFELYNPGAIFPGVIGGISIIIAAYSLQMLPINYSGLALIVLAIILFIIEIKVTSYGLLTIGGLISFLLGSIMLIDARFQFESISMSLIITAAIVTALFFVVLAYLGLRAQTRKKFSGGEGLTGEEGIALSEIKPGEKGRVKAHGEIWKAISDEEIAEGAEVEIVEIKNLTLKVKSK